jgi:hypothetical protein
MPLIMKTSPKGVARFEWSDDEAETTVTVEASDPEDVIVRKLKRVIALVDGEPPLPQRMPGLALEVAQMASPAPAPAQGNGWAAVTPPELPEDRKGEWELYPPKEQE